MKISILISKKSWANKYQKHIKKKLSKFSKQIFFLDNHKKIKRNNYVNIIFSYFNLIDKKYLIRSKFNIIPHESNLPNGKGMSPLTWQIINGKKKITFSLIEASTKIDSGYIYLQKKISIPEHYVFDEIKKLQLEINLKLISQFLKTLKTYKFVTSYKQKGNSSYFAKRTPKDHEINIKKSIQSQIDILRTSDNEYYPSFFKYKKKKFRIKIEKI